MNIYTTHTDLSMRSSVRRFLSITTIGMFLVIPSLLHSQWSGDPKVNTRISNAAGDQINPAAAGDGSGGAFIVWQDKRNGNYDLFAQRINAAGAIQWTTNGITVCAADSDQINPTIISDGNNGAIISWQDKRSGNFDIYTQRINASGALQWGPTTGAPVCVTVFDQTSMVMVSDGSGGALLTWEDYRSNAGPGLADVYVQRVNAAGVSQWTSNGIGVCTQAAAQHGPRLIGDGSGGAYLTWYDQRAGNYDIYAQHISSIGGVIGIANGGAVCTMATDQTNPDICADGHGGAIIAWQDFRSTTSIDIWVQRMTAEVAIRWVVNGTVMNNNVAYDQINPRLVSDGAGGAVMTWEDFRTGITSDIYAQRVDSTGVVATGWNVNGIIVSSAPGNQSHPTIVTDSSNGAVITWIDKRDSSINHNTTDVFASRITGSFAFPWTANGAPIGTADSTQTNPSTASDGNGGVIIAWQDQRSGNFDIYASRIMKNGVTTSVALGGSAPSDFELHQNYPNPFNPSTIISYQTAADGYVSLVVYDALGREVTALVREVQHAGNHSIPFDAQYSSVPLTSGMYFYRLTSGGFVSTKKMILLK
jgi:hypothetical protein